MQFFFEFSSGKFFPLFDHTQTGTADFQRADRLLHGFFEVRTDAHDFAHSLHLGTESIFRLRELFKRPAGELDYHIVAGGSVFIHRAIAPVGHFVQSHAGSHLGGKHRDRAAGGLTGQSTGTAGTGVDFNNRNFIGHRVVGKLHVAAADHAHGIQNPVTVILQAFLQFFGNSQHRSNAETVTGMHTHRIHVFDIADGDLFTVGIAHDFQFQLFPAGNALFDQHLTDQTGSQTARHNIAQFFHIVNNTAAGTAHSVSGTQHHRVTEFGGDFFAFFNGGGGFGCSNRHADFFHRILEFDTVFTAFDRFKVNTDDFNIIFGKDTCIGKVDCQVQRSLTAQVGQQGIGFFAHDDLFQTLHGQRFNVGMIGHTGVGHNRSGVAVRQNDFVAEAAEGFARLSTGVVKLASLTDNDRTGTDDEDLVNVLALSHN